MLGLPAPRATLPQPCDVTLVHACLSPILRILSRIQAPSPRHGCGSVTPPTPFVHPARTLHHSMTTSDGFFTFNLKFNYPVPQDISQGFHPSRPPRSYTAPLHDDQRWLFYFQFKFNYPVPQDISQGFPQIIFRRILYAGVFCSQVASLSSTSVFSCKCVCYVQNGSKKLPARPASDVAFHATPKNRRN